MNLFEAVKAAVTPRMAAERYGLPVRQGNMVCCPFHNDRTPSMKLNEEYFYCFGCGAHGDVVALTAQLFDLPPQRPPRSWRQISASPGRSRPFSQSYSAGNRRRKPSGAASMCWGTICKSCRTGRITVRRSHRRTPSTRAMRRPVICSSASGICWTFWPAARRRSAPRWWPTCRRTIGSCG